MYLFFSFDRKRLFKSPATNTRLEEQLSKPNQIRNGQLAPPAPVLLKQAAKLKSGSGEPNRNKVGTVTWSQCKQIAEEKMEDLNAFDLEAAAEMIAGTARSMGLRVNRDK